VHPSRKSPECEEIAAPHVLGTARLEYRRVGRLICKLNIPSVSPALLKSRTPSVIGGKFYRLLA
jgi:hypothetical protein